MPGKAEKRADVNETSGKKYTKQAFIDLYGKKNGLKFWDAAAPKKQQKQQTKPKGAEGLLLPGNLGTKKYVLKDDPRSDPRLVQALGPMADAPPPTGLKRNCSMEELQKWSVATEEGFNLAFTAVFADWPKPKCKGRVEVVKDGGGGDMRLHIFTPEAGGQYPCLIYTHGGGMAIQSTDFPYILPWAQDLAAAGLVVVVPDFRNSAGAQRGKPAPFPAGLDDCFIALQWVNDNKAALGATKVVISGESGGGNLCIATTMKAKKEGKLGLVQGTYALCPYIYGDYFRRSKKLVSQFENDSHFLTAEMCGFLARSYVTSADKKDQRNPLAWPYWAKKEDVEGFPPTVVSVNELDPLRDEGLAFYRTLRAAGVPGYSRVVVGTAHATELLVWKTMPDVRAATIRDIKGFADSL